MCMTIVFTIIRKTTGPMTQARKRLRIDTNISMPGITNTVFGSVMQGGDLGCQVSSEPTNGETLL